MEDLHDYVFVHHSPSCHAMPTYGIKKVSHRKCIVKHDLLLYYTISKLYISMEGTKFATNWYYSRVQLIDSSKVWRVEVK